VNVCLARGVIIRLIWISFGRKAHYKENNLNFSRQLFSWLNVGEVASSKTVLIEWLKC